MHRRQPQREPWQNRLLIKFKWMKSEKSLQRELQAFLFRVQLA